MIRVLLTLSLLFWSCIAQAQMIGNRQVVLLNPQVRPDNASAGLPSVDDNWAVGGYPYAGGVCAEWGHRVSCYLHQSTTRASTAYCTQMDGTLTLVATGVLRQCNGNGALIEEARTNSALWARDMTNAAWVKVGMGNALNAVGADGTANAATTLTATGTAGSCTASCTILQTLTLGSAADTYSVYLLRVTGSGAVNITINNLVGTTACTLVTTGFTRCTVTATLANPVIGIQLTTLNDVVVADFNQLEAGAFPTSAIPTTTVSVARAADNITAAGALLAAYKAAGVTQYTKVKPRSGPAASNAYLGAGFAPGLPAVAFRSTNTAVGIYNNTTIRTATIGNAGDFTVTDVNAVGSFDASGDSIVANGGSETTSSDTFAAVTSANIGANSSVASVLGMYLARLVVWNTRLPSNSRIQLSGQ